MSSIHKVLTSPSQILMIFGIPVSFDKKNNICKISGLGISQTIFMSPPQIWRKSLDLQSSISDISTLGGQIFIKLVSKCSEKKDLSNDNKHDAFEKIFLGGILV